MSGYLPASLALEPGTPHGVPALTLSSIGSKMLKGTAATDGWNDIWKCFDQIPRRLLYAIMLLAGMPPQTVSAYQRLHNNVQVRNSVGGGLGESYRKPCSIPQGCPFSMMLISLMTIGLVTLFIKTAPYMHHTHTGR